MNLKQLEAFAAVAALHTTTAAAQRLGLSQSAVSRLLAQLEEDLGLTLFQREQGRLAPTREADALVGDAEAILEAARCLERHAQQLRLAGTRRKLVRVMVPNTLAQSLLPSVLGRFYETYDDAVLEVFSGTYQASEQALRSREVDLAIVRLPDPQPGLTMVREFVSEAVCVMPAGHPLAALAEIGPRDLDGVPMVLLWRQSSMRHEVDASFRNARISQAIAAEVHSVSVACAMAERGIGVTIVSRLIASTCAGNGLVMRPFRPELAFCVAIAALDSEPLGPVARAFAEQLGEALAALDAPGAGVEQHPARDGAGPDSAAGGLADG
ncbi:LysR family transcriptional regulator [Burkholderia sp. 3C]